MKFITYFINLAGGMILCGISMTSYASNNIIISVDKYQPGDKLIVIKENIRLTYTPQQISASRINEEDKICYESVSDNNKITLQISHKNGNVTKYKDLSANKCTKLNSKFTNLTSLISTLSSKFFVSDSSSIVTYTKGANDEQTNYDTSPYLVTNNPSFCLAGSEKTQYLQPKIYPEMIVPVTNEYEGYITELVDSENGKVIQQSSVANNLAKFTNVEIVKQRKYKIRLLDKTNYSISKPQISITPYDINKIRFHKSLLIPHFTKDTTLTNIENEVLYNANIFDKTKKDYSYLYLNSLNNLNSLSKSFDNSDKDLILDFIEDYLTHYCNSTIN